MCHTATLWNVPKTQEPHTHFGPCKMVVSFGEDKTMGSLKAGSKSFICVFLSLARPWHMHTPLPNWGMYGFFPEEKLKEELNEAGCQL